MIFIALDTVAYRVHDLSGLSLPPQVPAPVSLEAARIGRASMPYADSIAVHDPNRALPRNQLSWE